MNSTLKKVKNKIRKNYFKSTFNYGKTILSSEQTNFRIREMILKEQPFMVSRLGSVELESLYEGIQKSKWTEETKLKMRRNAGFFPVTDDMLWEFEDLYLKCIKDIDLIGIWYNEGEDFVCRNYCPNAIISHLKDLEPYYHQQQPWSNALKGKNILVIHPFEESIKIQYTNRRESIYPNKDILPEFNLITLKAVQTIAGNNSEFENWFDALDSMCNSIKEIDFDIAIIGAGAYGLPIASFIKNLGKQAIHLGGATQILFGIKGKRWDNHKYISNLYNESWIRPVDVDIPNDHTKVENGCYW